MADKANTPENHAEALPPEVMVEAHIERVSMRRAPKYSVFLVAGAALGLLVAMIATFIFDGTNDLSPNTGLDYSPTQVFGFLSLIFIPVGLAIGGTTALILDRTIGRRTREVTVDRETVHQLPEEP